jgi:hypothetical protein
MAPGIRAIQKLKQNRWKGMGNHHCEVVGHLTHNPDLTPSDYHLFLYLQKHLATEKFHKDQQVKN